MEIFKAGKVSDELGIVAVHIGTTVSGKSQFWDHPPQSLSQCCPAMSVYLVLLLFPGSGEPGLAGCKRRSVVVLRGT